MTNSHLLSVALSNNRPATTSLDIAKYFGKRHDSVLRDIRNLIEACPEDFRKHNFVETFRNVTCPNNAERKEIYYTVFFDGFILLVMGYTGKKALQMKLAYIAAFNAMREKLENTKLAACKQAALPTRDKYEAYMEEVESVRAETAAKIDALLRKGLDMIDVKKFGAGAIVGFTPILIDWLQQTVCQISPIISSREPLSRALDYSPLYLLRHLEKLAEK